MWLGYILLFALMWVWPVSAQQDAKLLHERILYPTVRVTTRRAGGSGTLLWSKQKENGAYENYVLTNWHVIEGAIDISNEWDPIAKEDKKVEKRSTVSVEFFQYRNLSEPVGSLKVKADIVAWDEDEDLALLKLRDEMRKEYIATLIPRDKIDDIHLFDGVYAVGAGLGHDPFPTRGMITSKVDEIQRKSFWLSSANTIFGTSGGGLYLSDSLEFIGVPSRVAVAFIGFSAIVANYMGFFIPPARVYDFVEKQCYTYLIDSQADNPEECLKKRKVKEK